jgi:hypothetical protein
LNGLYPDFIGHGRLPRQIVNRALLSIRNESELDRLVHERPVAFGFGINGAFCHGTKMLLNYEIGPNSQVVNENFVSKCYVLNSHEQVNAATRMSFPG